jgi:hypothetical protein
MAKLYVDAQGVIQALRLSMADEAESGVPAVAFSSVLEIDETTNRALVDDIHQSAVPFRVVGGVLQKAGVAQTIAPPSAETVALRRLAAILQVLNSNAPAVGTDLNNIGAFLDRLSTTGAGTQLTADEIKRGFRVMYFNVARAILVALKGEFA